MGRRNVIAALVLLVLGATYAVLTTQLPDRTIPNTPGPSFFPWVVTGSLLVLAAGLLVQGIRQWSDRPAAALGNGGARRIAGVTPRRRNGRHPRARITKDRPPKAVTSPRLPAPPQ